MKKAIGIIGFIMILTGGGAMDSANMLIPIIIAFLGMALMAISAERGDNDTLRTD